MLWPSGSVELGEIDIAIGSQRGKRSISSNAHFKRVFIGCGGGISVDG